jgi:hypothetical protein
MILPPLTKTITGRPDRPKTTFGVMHRQRGGLTRRGGVQRVALL